MIEQGQITYQTVSKESLPPWARLLVEQFLEPSKVDWQLGDKQIDSVISLKLNHTTLEYLDIDLANLEFMWCVDHHHDSIPPDHASLILLNEIDEHTSVRQIKDGDTEIWEFRPKV